MIYEISLPISKLFKYSLHNDICLYKCIPSNCDTATAILLFILVPFLLEAAAADLSVVLCKKKIGKMSTKHQMEWRIFSHRNWQMQDQR